MFNKLLVSGLFAATLLMPMAASAAAPSFPGCTFPPDHAIWNDLNNQVIGCITVAAWDAAEAAQSHGADLPVFKYPAVIVDKYGISYACEAFLVHGCVDATKTAEYDTYIRNFGSILVHAGYTNTQLPQYAKLMNAVR